MTFEEFWQKLQQSLGLVERPKERALSMDDIFGKVYRLAEMMYPMAYLHNLYADSDGSMFAILTSDGKLYRSSVAIQGNEVQLDEWVEVVQEFPPVTTRTQIVRQTDGRARWFSISATSVLNRVGEIDSQALFDSFIAHATQSGEYPYRTFYHKGESFRTGQADFLARDGNCYITSGLYDDSEIARVEQAAIEREPDYWGESIGYLPTSEPQLLDVSGVKIPVYRTGIHKEISTLPEREAANLFTVIRHTEVNRMMSPNELAALIKLFGGDEAKARQWLEENVDETNRAIEAAGLVTRSQETPRGEPVPEQQAPSAVEIDDALLAEIVKRATESESFTGFGQQLNGIIEAIDALNQAMESVTTALTKHQANVTERLGKLERGKVAERQEWANDLPAKPNVTRVTMKSRFEQQPEEEQPLNGKQILDKVLPSRQAG